jgi:hypothetical protein
VLRVGRESRGDCFGTWARYRAQIEEVGAVDVLESLTTHPDREASAAAGRLLDRYFVACDGEGSEDVGG